MDNKTMITSILNKFPYTAKVDWEEWYINEGEPMERFKVLITWLETQAKLWERMIVMAPALKGKGGTFIGNNASGMKRCFGCSEEGHFKDSCPKARSNQGASSKNNVNIGKNCSQGGNRSPS